MYIFIEGGQRLVTVPVRWSFRFLCFLYVMSILYIFNYVRQSPGQYLHETNQFTFSVSQNLGDFGH